MQARKRKNIMIAEQEKYGSMFLTLRRTAGAGVECFTCNMERT